MMPSALLEMRYGSLIGLPKTTWDDNGNFFLVHAPKGNGLRHRYDYLMELDAEQLRNRQLDQLLNWWRWGSIVGVMWECTLPEMVVLIEKWEQANEEVPRLYGLKANWRPLTWSTFWQECGARIATYSRLRCPVCQKVATYPLGICETCNTHFTKMQRVMDGPRGIDTYNLGLHGADGHAVSVAAYCSRDTVRKIPTLRCL